MYNPYELLARVRRQVRACAVFRHQARVQDEPPPALRLTVLRILAQEIYADF